MLLENITAKAPDTELEAEYAELVEQTTNILDQIKILLEEPMGNAAVADRLSEPMPSAEDGVVNDPAVPPPGQVAPGEGASMEDVVAAMDQVMRQMEAAKRALGLVNKLGDSPSRTKNRSRIMSNMNRIRANVRRIEKMLSEME